MNFKLFSTWALPVKPTIVAYINTSTMHPFTINTIHIRIHIHRPLPYTPYTLHITHHIAVWDQMMREGCVFLSLVVLLTLCGVKVAAVGLPSESAPLIRHYYKVHNTCANVEPFVRQQVKAFMEKDKTIAPKVVKLLYADCMVNVRLNR